MREPDNDCCPFTLHYIPVMLVISASVSSLQEQQSPQQERRQAKEEESLLQSSKKRCKSIFSEIYCHYITFSQLKVGLHLYLQ